MRIKADFITNSSSTAYIVLVSDTMFNVNDISAINELESFESEHYDEFNEDDKEMLNAIQYHLSLLKEGRQLYRDDTMGWWTLLEYLKKRGAVFKEIDMSGGDGMDIIEPLNIDDIHKALNRIQKNEIET